LERDESIFRWRRYGIRRSTPVNVLRIRRSGTSGRRVKDELAGIGREIEESSRIGRRRSGWSRRTRSRRNDGRSTLRGRVVREGLLNERWHVETVLL
jgi:hypothetical protein